MTKLFDAWRKTSPHYGETHEELAFSLRKFIEREAIPHIDEWEKEKRVPKEFQLKAAAAGILGLGWPKEYGGFSEGVDIFHQIVKVNEIANTAAGGFMSGMINHTFSLKPLLRLGNDDIKKRIVPAILAGEKIVGMAITEPSGGSDVANIKTRAERRGDHYVLNGSKTLISNGMRADVFLVAAKTKDDKGEGISLFMLEVPAPGFDRTQIDKMGWHCSDTATLYFDDVPIPAANLLGREHHGLRDVLTNFNEERLMAAANCAAYSRICLEEAGKWAGERETFGKKLGQHQVIRSKLANMARHINATQAWIDHCAWQFQHGCASAADMALLKVQATQTFELVAREAAQVLGGASVVSGSKVERLYREVRIVAIGGGSEEILLDFAGRRMGFGAGFGLD